MTILSSSERAGTNIQIGIDTMADVSYTEEAKFPLSGDGGRNWGAIINGVLTILDRGLEVAFTAGEAISASDVVALKAADGKMYKALASDSALTPAIGVAPSDVASGSVGKVLGFGYMDVHTSYSGGSSVDFTAGDQVYVGSVAGQVSATRNSWGGPVGYAKADTNNSWDTRIMVRPGYRRSELVRDIAVEKQAHFAEEIWLGNLGAGETINWTNGNNQAGVLNANLALSFTDPSGPCHLTFRLIGDAVGGHTATWPVATQWPSGGTPLAVSLSPNYTDVFCAYYNGAGAYYGTLATSFT